MCVRNVCVAWEIKMRLKLFHGSVCVRVTHRVLCVRWGGVNVCVLACAYVCVGVSGLCGVFVFVCGFAHALPCVCVGGGACAYVCMRVSVVHVRALPCTRACVGVHMRACVCVLCV